MVLLKHFAKAVTLGGLAFLLLPIPSPAPTLLQQADAQAFPGRLRRPPPPGEANYPPPGPQTPAAPQNTAPVPPTAAPLSPTAAAFPPSMLQQPALLATVQFSAQSLSIHADNSSLRDILHQLSQQTGMDVQGLGADERVFGSFGPGNPQDVVNDLLNGTPYNVLMVGVLANGAPRQLVLSPVSHVTASAAHSSPPPANDDSDDAPDNDTQPVPQAIPAQNPPRDEAPPPTPGAPTVPSPQQLFQQLQQMREQQQQPPQPQQQQQQPPQQ